MPVSIPTTSGPEPSGSRISGSRGGDLAGEVAPGHRGLRAHRSIASASPVSAANTPPRIAPRSRMWRTSARVSTPGDPGHAAVGEPGEPAALGVSGVLAVDPLAHDHRAGVDAVGLHVIAA